MTAIGEQVAPQRPNWYQVAHTDERLQAAYRAHKAAGLAVAVQATRVAAELVVAVLPTAHRVIFDKRDSEEGAVIQLAYVRDAAGALIWHGENFDEHPDAVGLANVEAYGGPPRVQLHWETVDAIESVLADAYDVQVGCFDVSDGAAPGHEYPNLLEITIPEAVAAAGPPRIVTAGDPDALRTWLTDDAVRDTHELHAGWEPTAAKVADLVQDLSDNGADDALMAWRIHPTVRAVFTSHLDDGAVLFGADLVSGGRITTLPQEDRDLRDSRSRTGVDAAVEALTHVAALLNEAYARR